MLKTFRCAAPAAALIAAATLALAACSGSTPSTSTPVSTGRPAPAPTSARPAVTSASPAPSPTSINLAGVTCGAFEAMSQSSRTEVAEQFRDEHSNSIGNPMYASLDASDKAGYLVMSLDAFCSQDGRSSIRIAELTF